MILTGKNQDLVDGLLGGAIIDLFLKVALGKTTKKKDKKEFKIKYSSGVVKNTALLFLEKRWAYGKQRLR